MIWRVWSYLERISSWLYKLYLVRPRWSQTSNSTSCSIIGKINIKYFDFGYDLNYDNFDLHMIWRVWNYLKRISSWLYNLNLVRPRWSQTSNSTSCSIIGKINIKYLTLVVAIMITLTFKWSEGSGTTSRGFAPGYINSTSYDHDEAKPRPRPRVASSGRLISRTSIYLTVVNTTSINLTTKWIGGSGTTPWGLAPTSITSISYDRDEAEPRPRLR